MKQKPVYVMNHNQGNTGRPRSSQITCDEQEVANAMAAQMAYEGSGWTPRDVDIFNPYDGYSWFLPFFLEAFGWHDVGYGEARDFFNGDISVEGPHPLLLRRAATWATGAPARPCTSTASSSSAGPPAVGRSA